MSPNHENQSLTKGTGKAHVHIISARWRAIPHNSIIPSGDLLCWPPEENSPPPPFVAQVERVDPVFLLFVELSLLAFQPAAMLISAS